MNKVGNIDIPAQLKLEYFDHKITAAELEGEQYNSLCMERLDIFPYELLHYTGIAAFKPWKQPEETVPSLFAQWKNIRSELEPLYQQRDVKAAAPLMKQGIALCFSALFWMNEEPVTLMQWQEKTASLPFSTVNFAERMQFILQRPALFQSFKTLEQLMIELEKAFARSLIKKKKR